jgi:hypothetical protein
MVRIDQFSLTTAPIEQYFNDTKLGVATGFVWQVGNQPYLVTNWHVVTCRRFPNRRKPPSAGGRPNVLRVHFNIRRVEFGFEARQQELRGLDLPDERADAIFAQTRVLPLARRRHRGFAAPEDGLTQRSDGGRGHELAGAAGFGSNRSQGISQKG